MRQQKLSWYAWQDSNLRPVAPEFKKPSRQQIADDRWRRMDTGENGDFQI
jgi:hypothetical protein